MIEKINQNETMYCPLVKKEVLLYVCTHKHFAKGVYTKCKYFGGKCMHPDNRG
ncbi:MAG: hypothetical protein KAS30_00910 [Candidatus Diapherotrites archaeon]|nr:hypothetical protein [Candidatus Diapherotrites archaeon]